MEFLIKFLEKFYAQIRIAAVSLSVIVLHISMESHSTNIVLGAYGPIPYEFISRFRVLVYVRRKRTEERQRRGGGVKRERNFSRRSTMSTQSSLAAHTTGKRLASNRKFKKWCGFLYCAVCRREKRSACRPQQHSADNNFN